MNFVNFCYGVIRILDLKSNKDIGSVLISNPILNPGLSILNLKSESQIRVVNLK